MDFLVFYIEDGEGFDDYLVAIKPVRLMFDCEIKFSEMIKIPEYIKKEEVIKRLEKIGLKKDSIKKLLEKIPKNAKFNYFAYDYSGKINLYYVPESYKNYSGGITY